ncbi:MAG: penicillin-binding protein 2 [Flavobacteriaceae bacterium]|nr:penicillin-binding protein 2 [Flavobacteriaceae bacterium]
MERKYLAYFSILAVGVIFIMRLFYLQVIDDTYRASPLNNAAVKIKYDYPQRGYVYDRNGVLLVANQPTYDIMVIPKDVKEIDTTEFCNLLQITKDDYVKNLKRTTNYSPRIPSVFLAQVSKEDYAYLQEKMHHYKGFYIQKRSLREYPIKSAPNVLGYIGEANEDFLKKNPYYQLGEYMGVSGVEKQYEEILRGFKGVKFIQKDRFNKDIGPYKGGIYDTLAIVGKDLTLTLDIALQQYGEKLMRNKRGGIVAIEPSSGEILTLVSTPSYDPNMMVGRKRSKNSVILMGDTINRPTYDRGLQAQYPPGSPFKIINALIGLQEDVITTETPFYCYGGYKYGRSINNFMACHCGVHGSPIRLNRGIYKSCNAYFANVYRRIIEKSETTATGTDNWMQHAKSFGLGNFLGYDLPIGRKGLIPDSNFYNRYYPKGSWRAPTIISNAIGQGEVLTTPIQLANMTAAIANRGFYYTPHILKKVDNKPIEIDEFTEPKNTTIDKKHFEPVIEGMFNVVENPGGTARWSRVKDIEICGKTGTAENFVSYKGIKEQLTDHSVFIAFAPKDNPKIAIAVFVENGYWGSRWAGPIATLMIEKYLTGTTTRPWEEKRMFEGSLEDEYQHNIAVQKGLREEYLRLQEQEKRTKELMALQVEKTQK